MSFWKNHFGRKNQASCNPDQKTKDEEEYIRDTIGIKVTNRSLSHKQDARHWVIE